MRRRDGGFPLGHWSVTHRENENKRSGPVVDACMCGLDWREKELNWKKKRREKCFLVPRTPDAGERRPRRKKNHQGPGRDRSTALAVLTYTQTRKIQLKWQ